MRYLWLPIRLVALMVHIAWGLLAVLMFRWLPQGVCQRVVEIWSRGMLGIVGVGRVVLGQVPGHTLAARGVLVLANHVSWLDIYTLNAVSAMRFVAKSEIARWPLLGLLAKGCGTLFVERGRRHAVHAINQKIADHLQLGELIGVFPEGTTTYGDTLLPFHANMVQPALDVQAVVQPVAIRYTQDGVHVRAAAYAGGEHLLKSLFRILLTPRLQVVLHWLAPVPLGALGNRHDVAQAAREAIACALGITLVAPEVIPLALRAGPEDHVLGGSRPESAVDQASSVR